MNSGENSDRTSHIEIFIDDDGKEVRWRCIGSTAIGLASAGIRLDHWHYNDEGKYTLENAIMNTINVFEESVSLLKRGLINRELIRLSLNDDFAFFYRVIVKIASVYSNDNMMDFTKIELKTLNKEFEKIFGLIEDQKIPIARKHISEDTRDILTGVNPVNTQSF